MTAHRDHPRIRGEHAPKLIVKFSSPGSSPHTRGAPSSKSLRICRPRIIPAYAGSTACVTLVLRLSLDHPRIRGEHSPQGPAHRPARGSSPHTRGAPMNPSWYVSNSRIIPAYAGSTLRNAYKLTKLEDHPRIRGEHEPPRGADVGEGGSSPHTRGAQKRSDGPHGHELDHPRIRGEHGC